MEVETQDFYLTAFLCQQGLPLKDIRAFGDRSLFVFEDSDEFQELKKKYYWNEALVDPLLFKQEIRTLKGLTMNR